jgi:hypothetical protein
MGLDVTAYSKVTLVRESEKWCDEDDDGARWFGPRRGFDRWSPMKPGLYHADDGLHEFSAPYSAYNRWRNDLAIRVLGKSAEQVWNDPQPGPFVELINFSDCEGDMCSGVCARLDADFKRWEVLGDVGAQAHMGKPEETFGKWFRGFAKMFAHAANGGAVRFG